MTFAKAKSVALFLTITLVSTFVFYGGYRYFSGVFHIRVNFAQRHNVDNLKLNDSQKRTIANLSPDFRHAIYKEMENCIRTPTISDYYGFLNSKLLFSREPSSKEWKKATDYVESVCSSKVLDNVYETKGFSGMISIYHVLVALNYKIPEDWPERRS